ncbi:hypothetical protein [Pseudodesulfovibrio sp. zrk46]|uniref:hypothetical protein n=1 Tax=Pseudodesulfovibrio sp. zrk46 TaxID=2725288 RepID=UPI00144A14EF|nr:hypothetical protein [Pseudodesulfovibrio sp. zrk46]QJB55977.1 hypothetical protein HFN16_05935 [Pseudodesulfovibrio sp. zrk46]
MKRVLFVFVLVVAMGTCALAQPGGGRGQGGKRQGPPEEAYEACEGKKVGDKAVFTSPRGDEVTGICEERDGKMVLHPDNPPPRGQN